MNARIRELADSVGLGVRHDGIVLTKHVNAAEAFEQFAQLIIKECCEEIKQEPFNAGAASDWVKKHFGIEECVDR